MINGEIDSAKTWSDCVKAQLISLILMSLLIPLLKLKESLIGRKVRIRCISCALRVITISVLILFLTNTLDGK